MTPAQFAQRFAPNAAEREQVAGWPASQGLTVLGTSANGLTIRARGSVARLQTVFSTTLATYLQGTSTFFANTRAVTLRGSIAANVLSVSGLANTVRQQQAGTARVQAHASPRGYSPSDLANIYDVSPLRAQGYNGSGQTIAIATFADDDENSINAFDQQFGITSNVSRINVDGGAPLGQKSGEDETEADIEIVQGAAPGTNVLVYEAPNSYTSNQTAYGSETAWSSGSGNSHQPVGSGGGLSSNFSRPSYQAGPGVDNQYSDGHRQVPDVAADADPNTGDAVYTVGVGSGAGWGVVGGTSAAAPLWAGFAAVVNQAIGHNLGFLQLAQGR